ncbi:MAG: hypothetical protein ABIQ35_01725, partial [Verrucomicrobiota bacterium]
HEYMRSYKNDSEEDFYGKIFQNQKTIFAKTVSNIAHKNLAEIQNRVFARSAGFSFGTHRKKNAVFQNCGCPVMVVAALLKTSR